MYTIVVAMKRREMGVSDRGAQPAGPDRFVVKREGRAEMVSQRQYNTGWKRPINELIVN